MSIHHIGLNILISVFLLHWWSPQVYASSEKNLVLIKQDLEVKKALKKWLPLGKYLVEGTDEDVIVDIAPDIETVKASIDKDQVDVIFETLYQYVILDPDNKIEHHLNIWKKGTEEYQGCIVALEDNDISLQTIKNKKIAFEDPFSTGSFALPMASLVEGGVAVDSITFLDLEKIQKSKGYLTQLEALQNQKQDNPMYLFSGSDMTSIHWLKRGYVDAIGISCKSIKKIEQAKIVSESKKVPRLIVGVSKKTEDKIRDRVLDRLLDFDKSQEFLKSVAKAKKITKIKPELVVGAEKLRPVLRSIFIKSMNDLKEGT